MHFVTAQNSEEQISEICAFFVEHLRSSVKNSQSGNLQNFEDKLTTLNEEEKYMNMLEYLLTLKEDLVTLPTSHGKC